MSDYRPSPQQTSAATPYGVGGAPQQRWNVLSIVAFVLAFFVSIGAVICGHIALSQIKRTGEQGRGLAIAALVLGYLGILFGIIVTVLVIAGFATAVSSGAITSAP